MVVIPQVSRSANVVPLLLNVSFNFRGKFAYQEPYFQLPFDTYRKDKFRPKYYTSYREFTCAPILYTIHDVYMCIFVISIFFFFFFGLLTSHVRPSIGYLSPICLEPIGFRKCVFETNVDYEIRLTRNGGDKSSVRGKIGSGNNNNNNNKKLVGYGWIKKKLNDVQCFFPSWKRKGEGRMKFLYEARRPPQIFNLNCNHLPPPAKRHAREYWLYLTTASAIIYTAILVFFPGER